MKLLSYTTYTYLTRSQHKRLHLIIVHHTHMLAQYVSTSLRFLVFLLLLSLLSLVLRSCSRSILYRTNPVRRAIHLTLSIRAAVPSHLPSTRDINPHNNINISISIKNHIIINSHPHLHPHIAPHPLQPSHLHPHHKYGAN